MARLARIVIPGVAHHVIQRGSRRFPVFFGDDGRRADLDLIAHACTRNDMRVRTGRRLAGPEWIANMQRQIARKLGPMKPGLKPNTNSLVYRPRNSLDCDLHE